MEKLNKKQIALIVIIISLTGIITAGVISVISDAVFTPSSFPVKDTIYAGKITFNCGKDKMEISIREQDVNEIDEVFERSVAELCPNKEVSSVVDWNGRTYKQNQYGERSFDESKLIISDDRISEVELNE